MSDKCGNCDCADRSQCVKKGNQEIIGAEITYESMVVMEVAENDGCKCGSSCACGDSCACGGSH